MVKKGAGFLEVDKQVVQISNNRFKVNNVTLSPGLNKIGVHSISSSGKEKHYSLDIAFDPSAHQSPKRTHGRWFPRPNPPVIASFRQVDGAFFGSTSTPQASVATGDRVLPDAE